MFGLKKSLITPPRLKKGDKVGIIAPSKSPNHNAFTKKRSDNGAEFLRSLGLEVKMGKHVYDTDFYGGASIENRLRDLHDFYKDDSIKMIMMTVGGHFTNLMLDEIDYALIRNNPKIFIGMSDGTLLTNAIYKKAGVQTYYGVNLSDGIGFGTSSKIKQNFHDTFFTDKALTLNVNPDLKIINWATGEDIDAEYDSWNVIKEGTAKGKLIGGLLERLETTDFAGYTIDFKNKILFFESVSNIKYIGVYLSAMKQKGVFDKIKGMIVGYCCTVDDQNEVAEFLKYITKDNSFPIIQVGELGHNVESYVYPLGAKAELNTSKKTIRIRV